MRKPPFAGVVSSFSSRSLHLADLGKSRRVQSWVMVLVLGSAMNAFATTYFVAPNGDDAHLGTKEDPWLTPHKARDTLKAGDTVYFRQGTYPITKFVYINKNAGTPAAPITYASYPGETATLAFSSIVDPGAETSRIFYVARGYHRFERFNLTQTAESRTALSKIPRTLYAFSIWAPGVEVRDCEIHDITGSGVFASESADNLLVERNHIHHIDPLNYTSVAAPHGVYAYGQNVIIRKNTIHDLFYFCIKIAGDFTGKVYENFCYKAGEGITCQNGPGLQMDVDIFNNVITHTEFHASNAQGPGIDIYNGGGARVFNNTIAFSNFGAFILNTANIPAFKNNIFYENKTQIVTWRPTLQMDNNLYFSSTGTDFVSKVTGAGFSGDFTEWKRHYGEANSKVGDPKLAGRGLSVLDYKILAGSAAVDMGTASGAPVVDYLGQPRPFGARHDVGAFELGAKSSKAQPEAPGNFVVK